MSLTELLQQFSLGVERAPFYDILLSVCFFYLLFAISSFSFACYILNKLIHLKPKPHLSQIILHMDQHPAHGPLGGIQYLDCFDIQVYVSWILSGKFTLIHSANSKLYFKDYVTHLKPLLVSRTEESSSWMYLIIDNVSSLAAVLDHWQYLEFLMQGDDRIKTVFEPVSQIFLALQIVYLLNAHLWTGPLHQPYLISTSALEYYEKREIQDINHVETRYGLWAKAGLIPQSSQSSYYIY